MTYAGNEWIKSSFKVEMSPLGEAVADLLGVLYQGIYHIDSARLKKVDWSNDHHIAIVLPSNGFATVDFGRLTHLVILCHDRLIRCEIKGKSPWGYMELMFHARKSRTGKLSERHPTIEDAIKSYRAASGG